MSLHRRRIVLTAVALIALIALPALAAELAQVARSYRVNQDALTAYTWKSKVEVTVDGKLQSSRVYQVLYGEDGRTVRTPLDAEGQGKARKGQGDAEETLQDVRRMIDGYTQMRPEDFRKIFGDSVLAVTEDAEQGWTRVRARDVLAVGDSMRIWIDPGRHVLRKVEIETRKTAAAIKLVAEFEDLAEGPTYVARSVFESKDTGKSGKKRAKIMTVVTENYGHERR